MNSENVFKVCDEPHPLMISKMFDNALEGEVDKACGIVRQLYNYGYASEDIIQNIFRCTIRKFEETIKSLQKMKILQNNS